MIKSSWLSQDLPPSLSHSLTLLPTFDLFGKFHLCPPSSHIFPPNLSQISARKRKVSWQNLPSWCCALASTAFSTGCLGNYRHHKEQFSLRSMQHFSGPILLKSLIHHEMLVDLSKSKLNSSLLFFAGAAIKKIKRKFVGPLHDSSFTLPCIITSLKIAAVRRDTAVCAVTRRLPQKKG